MLLAGSTRRKRRLPVGIALLVTSTIVLGTAMVVGTLPGREARAANEPLAADAALGLSLAPNTPVIAAESTQAQFRFELRNGSEREISVSRVALFVSPSRVTSQSQLTEALSRTELPEDITIALASQSLGETAADSNQSVSFTIDTALLPLAPVGAAGVYVAYATVNVDGSAPQLTATPFVWQGTGTTVQTPVHTVVPLLFPTSVDGMPTVAQLGELTAANGRLSENLSAGQAQSSTFAVDPRVIVAVRGLGERAPTSASIFLERLSAAANTTFALQYADADLAAQGQLGLPEPLVPDGFSFYARDTPIDELTAFTYSLPAVAWPRQASLSGASFSFVRDRGFGTVLMSERNLSLSNASSGLLENIRVLSMNDACERLSGAMLTDSTAVLRNLATAQLVAELALINQSVTATVPVNCAVSRAAAREAAVTPVLDAIADLPWVQNVNFATVTQQTVQATLRDEPLPAERIDSLNGALANEPLIDTFSAVLEQPRYLAELQRLRILEFFATTIGAGSPGYEAATTAFFERDQSTLSGVHVSPARETNLVGSSSRIPVQVSNELPFTAAVSARVEVANFGLVVEDPEIPVTQVEKNSSVNLTVPVRARVSAGQSALIVSLYAENGLLVDEQVLPISIRSSWESIALIILGALVLAFFGFGIWRSIRARRSDGFTPVSQSDEP